MAQFNSANGAFQQQAKTLFEVPMIANKNGLVVDTNNRFPVDTLHSPGSGSYMGEHISVPLYPVIQMNSYEGIRERDTQNYTGGGGSVTDTDTVIEVSCTSTLGSYGVFRSRRFIPYRSGQTCTARLLARFGTPVAGTQQRLGIGNQENGYFVGWNGTDFQFLHSYGGEAEIYTLDVDNTASGDQTITLTLDDNVYTINILNDDTVNTIAEKIKLEVNDAVWLCNAVDDTVRLSSGSLGPRTGTFSFSSTGNVAGTLTQRVAGVAATDEWEDMTLPSWYRSNDFNHWQFKYSWDGVSIFVFQHSTNQWVLVHQHDTSAHVGLPVTKPAFKLTAVAYNTGGASGVTIQVASFMGANDGISAITKYTNGGGATKASLSSGTLHHIMSIQNPLVADSSNWRVNYRQIRFLDLTVAAQCNDPIELYLYFEVPLATGTHQWVSYPNRLYQASTVTGTISAASDTPVVALVTGTTGASAQFDLRDYNLLLPPGTEMSLVAKAGQSISKIAIGGTWVTIG